MCFLYVIIFLVCVTKTTSNNDDLVINLPLGKMRGHTLQSGLQNIFYAFQEIPYATPPVGDYRFREPRDADPWQDVLNATKNTKICMQQGDIPYGLKITEDCLYLNVYTPVNPKHSKKYSLPVVIWVHGGQFLFQGGSLNYYDPKYLVDYEIIVVTINYRLGVFGFLATSDGTIPGNLGLKDILLAIKWVHNNIPYFGGDRDKITVMGASSGAMSATYIQQSPLSKGLVRGYIIQIGTCISAGGFQKNPDYFAFKLGKILSNDEVNNTIDLLELLQKVPAEEILNTHVINDIYNHTFTINMIWKPSLENPNFKNALVTVPMLDALTDGLFDSVPMMIGATSLEGLTMPTPADLLVLEARRYDNNISSVINPDLNVPQDKLLEAAEEYKKVYTSLKFKDDIDSFMEYLSEELFSTPTYYYAEMASKFSQVYLYQFSYKGLMGEGPLNHTGVGHAEDIHYIFGGLSGLEGDPSTYPIEDQLNMKRMLKLWTNFIKFQNPTPDKDILFMGIRWPHLTDGKFCYMNINSTLEIKENLKHYTEVKEVLEKYRKPPNLIY